MYVRLSPIQYDGQLTNPGREAGKRPWAHGRRVFGHACVAGSAGTLRFEDVQQQYATRDLPTDYGGSLRYHGLFGFTCYRRAPDAVGGPENHDSLGVLP
jgi:hypothetical protein